MFPVIKPPGPRGGSNMFQRAQDEGWNGLLRLGSGQQGPKHFLVLFAWHKG